MSLPESPTGLFDPVTMRSRRLMQITNILICAYALGTLQFSLEHHWRHSLFLFVGIFLLLCCQWLNRRGATHMASVLLLTLNLGLSFLFIWEAEGLFDETVLGLPILLVLTGLLVGRRYFFLIFSAILIFIATVFCANQWGWRQEELIHLRFSRLFNIELILLVGGVLVYIVVNDLQDALIYLKAQIARYHESEKNLTYRSRHDELTGLPNRVYGRELLELAVLKAQTGEASFALLFIDLDHFKVINDSLGHLAGDRFLIQMAERLIFQFPESQLVCRLGGDEFLVGITEPADLAALTLIASELLTVVATPLLDTDTEVIASCSIGIAVYPGDGLEFDSLLTHADMAMYAAKEMGRNAFAFYDDALSRRLQENLKLISALRSALSRHEFVLHYQPVYELVTGKIVGAEALIRWQHPDLGLLYPTEFIPAAEKSGLILDIGAWVINTACAQMKQWQDDGLAPSLLSINLSPVQFKRGNIAEVISAAIARSRLQPDCLEFELTESTVIEDPELFMAKLQELKRLGVRIAIDDFGTGYSNLSYLQRFSVDKLKIDQSFVKQLQNGPQDLAIVTAIIQLAKGLHLQIVAEGIEDGATLSQLAGLHCQYGQGYWLARPQPGAEFIALLKSERALS